MTTREQLDAALAEIVWLTASAKAERAKSEEAARAAGKQLTDLRDIIIELLEFLGPFIDRYVLFRAGGNERFLAATQRLKSQMSTLAKQQ